MKKRVLIVDDEPRCRRLIAIFLEGKGWQTIEAHNGIEGLKIAKTQKPDLILADVNMPHISGLDVFKELKKNQLTKDIPFILMSADPKFGDIVSELGCSFFEKSTSLEELNSLINRIGNDFK